MQCNLPAAPLPRRRIIAWTVRTPAPAEWRPVLGSDPREAGHPPAWSSPLAAYAPSAGTRAAISLPLPRSPPVPLHLSIASLILSLSLSLSRSHSLSSLSLSLAPDYLACGGRVQDHLVSSSGNTARDDKKVRGSLSSLFSLSLSLSRRHTLVDA
jgi:hypothetical protein